MWDNPACLILPNKGDAISKKLLLIAALLFCAPFAHAQGASYTAGPFNTSGLLYVCPVPAGGTPCPSPSSLFSNVGLSTPLANPIPISQGQTVSFFITAGQYTVQMPAAGYSQIVQIGGGGGAGAFSALTPSSNSNVGLFQWTQAGVFTNTQMNDSVESLLNSCSPLTENQIEYGNTSYQTNAIIGCAATPSGSTVIQINAVAGLANSNANSSNRTVNNAVGVFGQGRCIANHCAVWGMNSIADDTAGLTADNMESMEIDQNIHGSPTYISALQINGVSFAGAVFPTTASMVDLIYSGPVIWPNAFHIHPGVSPIGAWFDGLTTSNSSSQTVRFTAYNGSTAENWGHMVDLGTNYHLDGPGNLLLGTTIGELTPNTPAAPTASLLAYSGFFVATTVTSSSITLFGGHSIVIGIQSGTNATNSITGITDTLGNTYKRLSSATAGTRDMEFWVSPCLAFPGIGTITATQSPSAAIGFFAWDVVGLNCSTPLGVTANAQVASATSGSGAVAGITTSSPNEIILSFVVSTATNTCTQGSGYTLDQGTSTSLCAEHQTFAAAGTANTAPITFTSTTWWQGAISLQSSPQLGTPSNPWPSVTASQYQTGTNCLAAGSGIAASAVACGSAAAGMFSIPITTPTSAVVTTTALTPNSEIFVTQRLDTTTGAGAALGVTCNTTPNTTAPNITARTATTFTITFAAFTTNPGCYQYEIKN